MKNLIILLLVAITSISCKEEKKEPHTEQQDLQIEMEYGHGEIETENWLELNYQLIDDNDEEIRFASINNLPNFPGGYDSLAKFIVDTYEYPETAIKDSVEGRNKSTFVVDKSGKVIDVEIIEALRSDLDSATFKVISKIPNWEPAELRNGQKVKVKFLLPIRFMLNDKKGN
ncbi:energy transducer TonB [Flavobacteriaceae bacterium 3-367]